MLKCTRRASWLASTAILALAFASSASAAPPENLYQFDIKGEPLSQALQEYGIKTSRQLIFSEDLVRGQKAPALQGRYTSEQALAFLLEKTDLVANPDGAGVLMIERKKTIERRRGTH